MDAPLSDQPRNLVAWELELTAPDKKKGWAEFFFFFLASACYKSLVRAEFRSLLPALSFTSFVLLCPIFFSPVSSLLRQRARRNRTDSY